MPHKTPYLLHKTKGDRNILFALLNSVSKNAQEARKRLHVTEIVFTSVMCGRFLVHSSYKCGDDGMELSDNMQDTKKKS